MKKNNIVVLLGLSSFIVMADNWVVSPILPSIANNLNIDIAKAGLLIAAYMLPFGIFQIIFGPLADRYGKKRVIAFAIAMFTLASGLCALGTNLANLALFRALTGVFAAAVMPISLALIGDIFPMHQRQGAIGTFMGISFLGQGLSMAIGGTIAFFLNWRGVFAIYALFSLIPVFLLIRNYKLLPSEKHPGGALFTPYGKLLGSSRSLFTYILILLEGILVIGSFSFIGAYISKTFGLNNFYIGLIMTGFGIMTVIGGRVSGKIAAKMGARKILSLGLITASAADLVIYLYGHALFALIIGIALLGLGFIFTHSTLLTRAMEFAQKNRGAAMSLVAFCFMGGGGIGTAIGGRIIASAGLNTLFLICAVGLVVALLLSFVLIHNRVQKGETEGEVSAGRPSESQLSQSPPAE